MRQSATHSALVATATMSALAVALGPASLLGLAQQPSPSGLPAGKEELIAEKDRDARLEDQEDRLCFEGPRIAWRTKRGDKWAAVVNGQDQATGFDELKLLVFSQDCSHFFYSGRRAKKWVLMRDGQQLGPESDEEPRLSLSSDGLHWVYVATRAKKSVLVREGKESAEYDGLGMPTFSRDGRHILHPVKRGKKWVLLLDEKEMSPEVDDIWHWNYIGETNRIVFVGQIGDELHVYLDGKKGPAYTAIGGLVFNQDGTRFAYGGAHVDRRFKALGQVIVDGTVGQGFPGGIGAFKGGMLRERGIDLSFGYFNNLLEEYHGVSAPISSGEPWHIAYVSRREKGERIVLVDNKPGPPFEKIIGNPVFSADGQKFAYVAKDKSTYSLLRGIVAADINTTETKLASPASFDYSEQMIFSADSHHFAFVSVKEGVWKGATIRAHRRVWLDGQPGTDYDALGLSGLAFSADGQHLAYIVHDPGNKKDFLVLDGREGKQYEEILFGALKFNGTDAFVFIAREGRKYLRVTEPIPK